MNSEQDRLKIGWFRRALGLSQRGDLTGKSRFWTPWNLTPTGTPRPSRRGWSGSSYKYFGRNLRSEIDHLGNSSRVDLGFLCPADAPPRRAAPSGAGRAGGRRGAARSGAAHFRLAGGPEGRDAAIRRRVLRQVHADPGGTGGRGANLLHRPSPQLRSALHPRGSAGKRGSAHPGVGAASGAGGAQPRLFPGASGAEPAGNPAPCPAAAKHHSAASGGREPAVPRGAGRPGACLARPLAGGRPGLRRGSSPTPLGT